MGWCHHSPIKNCKRPCWGYYCSDKVTIQGKHHRVQWLSSHLWWQLVCWTCPPLWPQTPPQAWSQTSPSPPARRKTPPLNHTAWVGVHVNSDLHKGDSVLRLSNRKINLGHCSNTEQGIASWQRNLLLQLWLCLKLLAFSQWMKTITWPGIKFLPAPLQRHCQVPTCWLQWTPVIGSIKVHPRIHYNWW